jgi:hypothetical protein
MTIPRWPAFVLATAVLPLAPAVRADAATLCVTKNGSLRLRVACRPRERVVDPAAIGLQGPPGPPGECVCPNPTTTSSSTSTTTTIPPACGCGSVDARRLAFTTVSSAGRGDCGPSGAATCGNALDDAGDGVLPLCCGGLYVGSGLGGLPLPLVVPDLTTTVFDVAACSAPESLVLGPTPLAAGNPRTCSGVGCLFGPPLPVPNATSPAVSVCLANVVARDASGTAHCSTGTVDVSLGLSAGIYLTGDLLDGSDPERPDVAGIQPCPLCSGGTCLGGPNDGDACTPGSGAADATSHDCPPPAGAYLGSVPIDLALATAVRTATATDRSTQSHVFCGYCTTIGGTFQNPPRACTTDGDCTTSPFTRCRQKHPGAFGTDGSSLETVRTITAMGRPAGSLGDQAPHEAALASVFCIPPTFNGIVDGSLDLPGPGAVALEGALQLLP